MDYITNIYYRDDCTLLEKGSDVKHPIALLISRFGFLIALPFIGIKGDSYILLADSKFGAVRYNKYGRFHNWIIYLGRKRIELFSPGEYIQLEQIDPYDKRYTREVNFNNKTYIYHSGIRRSYYQKYPNNVTETPVWVPDIKHKDDSTVVSFGLVNTVTGEIIDLEACLKEWNQHEK